MIHQGVHLSFGYPRVGSIHCLVCLLGLSSVNSQRPAVLLGLVGAALRPPPDIEVTKDVLLELCQTEDVFFSDVAVEGLLGG